MPSDQSAQTAGAIIGTTLLISAIITVAVLVFYIFIFWRICAKAGYSGALSLLNLIPGVGTLILLCILAFGTWPNQQMPPMGGYGMNPQQQPQPQYPSGPNYPQYRG